MSVDDVGLVGRQGAGPMLSDGTLISDLVDLETGRISLRLFSDPEVYQAELQHLFARSWNVVGHESEVPEPGDFVTRRIAEDSVIMVRGREGEVSVLLNVCSHRGMQVCRSEAGNSSNFKCPYHGWVYGPQGNLVGAPFERDMYGESLPKQELGLRRARVQTYAGIVFANWDGQAPALDEFLGDFTWYLDAIFKRSNSGLECLGAPQRFLIGANWKIASEQFCGADGYHAATLHKSLIDGLTSDPKQARRLTKSVLSAMDIGSPQGHGMRTLLPGPGLKDLDDTARSADSWRELFALAPPEGTPPSLIDDFGENLTPGQIHALLTRPPGNGGLFPNVGYLGTNLRIHVPVGVGQFEMMSWVLVEKDAPPAFKEELKRKMLASFGSAGLIEQDDAESWPAIQKSSTGYIGRQQSMRYHTFAGHNPPDGWEGGAYVYPGFSKDDSAWHFWSRYRDYMSGADVRADKSQA